MKKILLLFLLFYSCIVSAINYQFPFSIGDSKWIEYHSATERKAALQIPDAIVHELSTKELIDICLDYPYLFDITLYDDFKCGLNIVSMEFNGFKELFCREDLIDELLEKYSTIPSLTRLNNTKKDSEKANFAIQCVALRYMLGKNTVYDKMSPSQKNMLLSFAIEDANALQDFQGTYIGMYDFPELFFSEGDSFTQSSESALTGTRSSSYNMGTRYTPHYSNVNVGILKVPDFSSSTILYYKNLIEGSYDGAVVIGDATMSYNCHGYAWHVSEGGDNVWIGVSNSAEEDIYWNDGSYIEVPEAQSTKVSYSGDHSANRISNTEYISKWGYQSLVRHHPNNVPSGYGSPNKFYKRYSPYIQGASSIITSQTYSIPNFNSCLSVTWSINNSAFTLVPSGSQCTVIVNDSSQCQTATLTAVISRSGHNIYTITKSVLFHKPFLNVDGIQYEYTSSSGMYPEQTFNISASNAVNGYSSSSIAVNGDCDITLVSDRFKGMNISFEGDSSLLPTDVYYDDDWVDFHLEESSTPYTLVMRAQSDGGYYNFNLNFTVSPFPELYQMYYDDDPELVVNLSGNALSIFLSNAIGSELGGGLIQQSTWYLRIYRAQTGAQVYSQTVNGPSTNVYVNNYVNGLYIVTAIYNGNTYHAKVYVNH